MIQPRFPVIPSPTTVIPSAARNLKSITARLDSQHHAYVVTKSESGVRTLYSEIHRNKSARKKIPSPIVGEG